MRDYYYLMNVREEIKARYPLDEEEYNYTPDERELLEKLDDALGLLIREFKRNRGL